MLYQFESPAARLCVNIKVDQIRNTVIPKTSSFLSAACFLGAKQLKASAEVSAFIGNDVTMPCQLIQQPENTNITQVQWTLLQPEQEGVPLIVYNSQLGLNIPNSPLSQRVKLAGQSLIIKAVEMEDAGLYTCSISAFPSGKFERITKLVVEVQTILKCTSSSADKHKETQDVTLQMKILFYITHYNSYIFIAMDT
uniref:Ig-like domain-containing protein n=2 Tax=Haplochromini TaxID=319058 RepID=A0A3Q3C7P9_HAPBU